MPEEAEILTVLDPDAGFIKLNEYPAVPELEVSKVIETPLYVAEGVPPVAKTNKYKNLSDPVQVCDHVTLVELEDELFVVASYAIAILY